MAQGNGTNGHSNLKFWGYRRENGRVGVRNHVIILPLDDLSNAACEAVANNIKGTLALPHAYGRLQFGEDLELHFRTLIGTGSNPNVAAVVVIGIEDRLDRAASSRASPRPASRSTASASRAHGDIATIAKASSQSQGLPAVGVRAAARGMPDLATSGSRPNAASPTPPPGLASCPTVGNMYDKLIPQGIYGCFGETSEITGAEHLCQGARGVARGRPRSGITIWKAYQDDVIEAHKTDDLSESQPTKGNIAGGLTTIEEKALGNLEKIGRECRYIDALEPAEAPAKGPGLYFMDTSSAAAECVTLMAAAGYVVHTFPTGQGNVIGNPIVPVIKITGNPKTVRTMARAHRRRRLGHPAPRDDDPERPATR